MSTGRRFFIAYEVYIFNFVEILFAYITCARYNELTESGTKWEMLFGSFTHTLDEKYRLVIPSKFRGDLTNKLYILKGFDGSLSLFPENAFKTYVDNLSKLDPAYKSARDVLRIALSSVIELDLDAKNRVVLPSTLLTHNAISKNVVVVGMVDHLEIWDESTWNKYLQNNEKSFEEKFEDLKGKNND